jgi:hypothetical protein
LMFYIATRPDFAVLPNAISACVEPSAASLLAEPNF